MNQTLRDLLWIVVGILLVVLCCALLIVVYSQ